MAAVAMAKRQRVRPFGPSASGTLMTPCEFDKADFVEGYRYELIHGVLVVSPPALENERDPNEELGHWLRNYREAHPQGAALDKTLPEHTVVTEGNRRRADRVIWAGLGRLPRKTERPTIIVEFVSAGKRDRTRDYVEKRDEYLGIGMQEYWVIDRFHHTLTVFTRRRGKTKSRVFDAKQSYTTEILPGFVLSLAPLFTLADSWPESEDNGSELA
jgi:Uma2 family endonuclease